MRKNVTIVEENREGYYLDRDNFLLLEANIGSDGKAYDEYGKKLKDRTEVVKKTCRLREDDVWVIHDTRAGLWFTADQPVADCYLSMLYNSKDCKASWIKQQGPTYELLGEDELGATHLLINVRYLRSDLEGVEKWIEGLNPVYTRNYKSKSKKSGRIWAVIPKSEINEDLLF